MAKVGETPPDFEFELSGETLKLSDVIKKGKPVVIDMYESF